MIIVNGEEKTVTAKELTYDEVVALAFECYFSGMFPSITYTRARGNKEGILTPGQTVKIKNGTIFNAYRTGNA